MHELEFRLMSAGAAEPGIETGPSQPEARGSVPELPRRFNAAVYFVDRHLREGRGAKAALIDDAGAHPYAELADRVNRFGNVLKRLAILAEQRVMLCLPDGIDFPAAFWGTIKTGAVAVPANPMLSADDYGYLLANTRARALVVSRSLLDRLAPALTGAQFLQSVLVVGWEPDLEASVAPELRAKLLDLRRLTEQASPELQAAATVADDIAFWLYSSGSTGRPKAVMHRHESLFYTALLSGQRALGIGSEDVIFSAAKMFFAYGLGNSVSIPLAAGATAVVSAERSTPKLVASVMERHQPTVFFAVPTLYSALLGEGGLGPAQISRRLRLCASAGEALPAELAERWQERFGVEILDGLGSTEMLHNFLSNRPGQNRPGASGRPVPGYTVMVLNEEGEQLAPGEVGDLWCRGPSAASGYWNNRQASKRTFLGPWVRTGDKYTRDADGYFHYVGRSDEMLKVSGMWVSPFEVESALASHPQVSEAAVVGRADADGLVKPKAFVVPRAGAAPSAALAEELKAFVKQRLLPHKYPRWIEFREQLPRTATGKIQRFKLREP